MAEAELTFEKALKLAQAIETANKYVLDLQCQNKTSADVMFYKQVSGGARADN